MSEEQIRQKLKSIGDTRKSKEKDRISVEKSLKELRPFKKLDQHHIRVIANLVELAFADSQDTEDSLLALWERELNMELKILQLEKIVEELKQKIDWSEQNR